MDLAVWMGEGYGAVGGAEVYADCRADWVRHEISVFAFGAQVAPPWGDLRKVFIVNDIGSDLRCKVFIPCGLLTKYSL